MAKVSHSNPFLDDVWHPARKITTTHVFPPIPDRSHDWCAYYDDIGADCSPSGWGATEAAAIEDLKQNYEEEAA